MWVPLVGRRARVRTGGRGEGDRSKQPRSAEAGRGEKYGLHSTSGRITPVAYPDDQGKAKPRSIPPPTSAQDFCVKPVNTPAINP